MNKNDENYPLAKKIALGVGVLAVLIVLSFAVSFVRVRGSELGVRETWSGGVDEVPLTSGTHILFPGWTQKVYIYDMSSQVFVMNDDKANHGGKYKGKDEDVYHVQSSEGQDMAISLNIRWRLDPEKLVQIHRTIREGFEEKLIRPVVMRVVKDEATVIKAIDAYSGAGLVKLQQAIQKDLLSPDGELSKRGIIVENFVIEGIKLDDTYIGEIRSRQVASQKKLRYDEEAKAAEADALKEKAVAQSQLNKQVVAAEAEKMVGVLKAKQDAEVQLLAAEAAAKKIIVEGEAEKTASLMKAAAIEALGKAKAEATKLELSAYSVAGADNYTRMKIAEGFGNSIYGIKGYLPSNMSVNVLSENFMRTVESFMAPAVPQKANNK